MGNIYSPVCTFINCLHIRQEACASFQKPAFPPKSLRFPPKSFTSFQKPALPSRNLRFLPKNFTSFQKLHFLPETCASRRKTSLPSRNLRFPPKSFTSFQKLAFPAFYLRFGLALCASNLAANAQLRLCGVVAKWQGPLVGSFGMPVEKEN